MLMIWMVFAGKTSSEDNTIRKNNIEVKISRADILWGKRTLQYMYIQFLGLNLQRSNCRMIEA